jgi:hypothetical protein
MLAYLPPISPHGQDDRQDHKDRHPDGAQAHGFLAVFLSSIKEGQEGDDQQRRDDRNHREHRPVDAQHRRRDILEQLVQRQEVPFGLDVQRRVERVSRVLQANRESMPSPPITTASTTMPITTYNSVMKWFGKKGTLSFSVSGCVVAISFLLYTDFTEKGTDSFSIFTDGFSVPI